MTLAAHHYTMLHTDRAISTAVIERRGYCTLDDPGDLRDLGFSKAQARTAPVLAIPLWDVHGGQTGWHIRPDTPRVTSSGKVLKYENAAGSRLTLDVHPTVQPLLGDPTVPLWITEGIPKGDALVSCGVCAIALRGVWGFKGTNDHGGKVILPDWQHVAFNDREVIVVFDSDLHLKPDVAAALDALYAFLRSRGARPGRVLWPEPYQQTKTGVDDYLAHHGTLADLRAVVPPIGHLPTISAAQRNGHGLTPATNPDDFLTDTYNGAALVADHGHRLRYCYPWDTWLVWTGTHWQRDTSGEVMRLATDTVKGLARRLTDLHDSKAIAELLTHIKASLSTAKRKAMIESAQSEKGIAVQPAELDTHPWLLNCANGTLDLRTGALRPHDQADLLTKCLPIAYDKHTVCPTWNAFIWRIMGGSQEADDPDTPGACDNRRLADERAERLRTFLQRATGYALTGDTREQCVFVAHGTGSNGKSTALETLQRTLGDYAQSTPSATLLVKDRGEGIPNDIARLRGARLVTAVEIGDGKRLNEELLKRLTGQDTLTARFLRAEFFDFTPEFKLFIACNHLPKIYGSDHAIWRRIKRIPFTVTIPDTEQDKTLPDTLKAEAAGILAWMVQGCLAWQRDGLQIPPEVHEATHEYRQAMDGVGRFIEECCLVDAKVQVKASDLYEAYKRWCDASGEYAVTATAFGIRLEEKGFPKRTSNGTWRLGVGLISTQ